MTGDKVCRALLENPATARIPVLMMSGHLGELAKTAEDYENVVAALPKPFLSGALIGTVEKVIAAGPLPHRPGPMPNPMVALSAPVSPPVAPPAPRRTVPPHLCLTEMAAQSHRRHRCHSHRLFRPPASTPKARTPTVRRQFRQFRPRQCALPRAGRSIGRLS